MTEDRFDKFVDNLQKEILEKEKTEYNDYIVELFHNPKNWGKPSDIDMTVSQSYKGPCGDTMQFFLKINNNMIEKANFLTTGCGASVAAACQTTLLIEGKTIDFAENLDASDIDDALNGLPEDHKHCAELAKRTIRKAISKYKNKEKK